MRALAVWTLAVLLLAAPVVAQETLPPKEPPLATLKEKASYGIGLNIGRSLARDGLDIDAAILAQGIRDALANAQPRLTEQELEAVFEAFQAQMEAKQNADRAQAAQRNLAEGAKFLAENRNQPGVQTTPSGLQYKVVRAGAGASPKATDRVRTHYRGTLLNGVEFDSSYARGQPAVFPVGGVIKGWTEALQRMKVGDKWMLYIPAELAYGERGAGADIGPNATLVFEIELLGIE